MALEQHRFTLNITGVYYLYMLYLNASVTYSNVDLFILRQWTNEAFPGIRA